MPKSLKLAVGGWRVFRPSDTDLRDEDDERPIRRTLREVGLQGPSFFRQVFETVRSAKQKQKNSLLIKRNWFQHIWTTYTITKRSKCLIWKLNFFPFKNDNELEWLSVAGGQQKKIVHMDVFLSRQLSNHSFLCEFPSPKTGPSFSFSSS